MGYPKVTINVQNGALGGANDIDDGIVGLIVGEDIGAGSTIVQETIYTINSIEDAKTQGFEKQPRAYREISEFYNEAGPGRTMYVMVVADTYTMEDICNSAHAKAYLNKIVNYASGAIKSVGVCRVPDGTYTPTFTKGLDDDVIAAVVKAQANAEAYEALYQPIHVVIEGRAYKGVTASLESLKTRTDNRVSVSICSSDQAVSGGIHDKSAAVGMVLGKIAANPVQRKISRVKDGSLAITAGYLASDATYKKVEDADIEGISEKGYICIRSFVNKSGYWFADDPTATANTDDYSSISNRRVIDKAIRIVYATYVNELNDDVEIDSTTGKLSATVCKYYQGLIDNAVNNAMTANGEISGFSSYVDPNQNVLSTGEIAVVCTIVPKGYSKEIVVELGFTNPAI